jgi:hypothetical protein
MEKQVQQTNQNSGVTTLRKQILEGKEFNLAYLLLHFIVFLTWLSRRIVVYVDSILRNFIFTLWSVFVILKVQLPTHV